MRRLLVLGIALLCTAAISTTQAQTPAGPDWKALENETMRHFQALLKLDTSRTEQAAADYLKHVLEAEGIPVELVSVDATRPNVIARLKGSGAKRPLLIMAHTDVVSVDPKKWTHPPFAAERNGGHVYGRGTVDDKDNVAAALMVMLTLKRQNVALDRDVIFLAESGEEGATRFGIQPVVNEHFAKVDAEYCLAEGGNVTRTGGTVRFASVQALEKIPRGVELTARGPAGHGSVPLRNNAIVHLASAVAKAAAWKPPVRLNDTTRAYFTRLASISSPDDAQRYRDVLSADKDKVDAADEHFLRNEPRHASMLRTSISPNIIQGGYQVNVIPSEAKAMLDVRMHPDDDHVAFLEELKKVINDPAVEATWSQRDVRPASGSATLTSDGFKAVEAAVTKHYEVVTLPSMATGATDMAYLRAKGMQCYGIGPATDSEDGPKGFGAHSDQERILEVELHRFVRFHYDIVHTLAAKK
ncbi:MAG TPA: M20/M25/M40 family metallo-hydrolase [Vicinamibacterales bacterium]|nr:M20/M25/M40 family metallo-hydrolase [Vicinamibacterales bacterium]